MGRQRTYKEELREGQVYLAGEDGVDRRVGEADRDKGPQHLTVCIECFCDL